MSYGLVGLKNSMEDQAMRGLGDLAQQQEQQKRHGEQIKEADRQRKVSGTTMGATTGAMIGAQYGSVGGPWGAVIGAAVGFLASDLF